MKKKWEKATLWEALPQRILTEKSIQKLFFQEADLTMVNVFATWCGPCVNEIPYLAEL